LRRQSANPVAGQHNFGHGKLIFGNEFQGSRSLLVAKVFVQPSVVANDLFNGYRYTPESSPGRRTFVKVDESAQPYYRSTTMRLLLLLSAFLTAMVGVGTPAAAAMRPACEVSTTANVRAVRHAPRIAVVAARKFGALDRVHFDASAPHSAPALAIPLYLQRLRV
jgi:hypothetical protein